MDKMINYIFENNWNNINEITDYLEQSNIKSFSQGFFTKVFRIEDFILKVNCGDPDYGFMEYKKYFTEHKSNHSPICYRYKEVISNNSPHYVMLTEILEPFPNVYPEHIGITCLRELIKNNLNNDNINYNDIIDHYKNKLSDFELTQVTEIFNFFKYFKTEKYSIDICSINLMLRNKTWIVNDPLVLLHSNEEKINDNN